MTAHSKSIVEAALSLPADDRAELAERLISSLDKKYQAELEAAWNVEIERRFDEIERGDVQLIPGDEALRMFKSRTKP
jgi:putative addiction module component (TIGR02574 family)